MVIRWISLHFIILPSAPFIVSSSASPLPSWGWAVAARLNLKKFWLEMQDLCGPEGRNNSVCVFENKSHNDFKKLRCVKARTVLPSGQLHLKSQWAEHNLFHPLNEEMCLPPSLSPLLISASSLQSHRAARQQKICTRVLAGNTKQDYKRDMCIAGCADLWPYTLSRCREREAEINSLARHLVSHSLERFKKQSSEHETIIPAFLRLKLHAAILFELLPYQMIFSRVEQDYYAANYLHSSMKTGGIKN